MDIGRYIKYMSRQRGYLANDFRRLRNDIPIYKATDSEIQSDLSKLKYSKKPEPEITTKQELPKKRKAPIEDDKFVIDGLVKLQSAKSPEVKKPPQPVTEKKQEKQENQGKSQLHSQSWMNFLVFQNQLNMMRGYMLPQFGMPPSFPGSSGDKHLRIARFIQSHKTMKKN